MSTPIKLAMEIPTQYLENFTPLTDIDFALAHKVLENERYALFYRNRPDARTLVLDNSMHELGKPLPVADLRRAAELVRADYVIAPDQLGCPQENLSWFEETLHELGHNFHVGVVMAGNSPAERIQYLRAVRNASLLCLPFREPRLEWFMEQQDEMREFKRIHLLGVNELLELQRFAECAANDTIEWAVDTAKPIKWADAFGDMRVMYELGISPRGAKLGSKELLDLSSFSEAQLRLAKDNVAFLRTFLS